MNDYTIIINTYPRTSRQGDLLRCLSSLERQSYSKFSVVVVENNTDRKEVEEQIKKINFRHPISIINDPKKKLSYLFNLGWNSTKASLLAFIADDAEAEEDWLKNINSILVSDPQVGVVSGPVISTCYPAGEMHRLYLASQKTPLLKAIAWPYLHFSMEDNILAPGNLFESGAYSLGAGLEDSRGFPRQEIDLATTTSMGIRRECLEKVLGFDENFNFNHADGDLFIRIKKAGYKILFDPLVVVHHYVRLGPSRDSYNIGRDTGHFYRKDIQVKTASGLIGGFLNILFLNSYWVYSAIKNRKVKDLKGISGFISGYLSSTF